MNADPEQDDDGGGTEAPEPVTAAPVIESEDYDDGLTPMSTDYVYRGRDPDGIERR